MNRYGSKGRAWWWVLAASALLVAACGKGGEEEGITLRYMRWTDPAELEATRILLDVFEERHPGITVKLEFNSWDQYWPKLQTMLAAGDPPDVFMMSGLYFHDFQSKGVLANLSGRIRESAQIDLNDFFSLPRESFTVDGILWALPRDFNCVGLFYNRGLFDEAGVPYPDSTWTWEDLRRAAKKLTRDRDADGRADVWGFQVMNELEVCWGNFVYQNGGRILDEGRKHLMLQEPEALAAIDFLRKLIFEDKCSPNPAQVESMAGTPFRSGRIAMVANGSWMLRALEESGGLEYGVAPLPRGKRRATIANGVAHAIAARAKHPDEAWELVSFLSGREGQESLARSGTSIPVLRSVAYSPVYLEGGVGSPEAKRVFLEEMEYAEAIPFTPRFARWYEEVKQALDLVWLGQEEPRMALRAVAPRVNSILAGFE